MSVPKQQKTLFGYLSTPAKAKAPAVPLTPESKERHLIPSTESAHTAGARASLGKTNGEKRPSPTTKSIEPKSEVESSPLTEQSDSDNEEFLPRRKRSAKRPRLSNAVDDSDEDDFQPDTTPLSDHDFDEEPQAVKLNSKQRKTSSTRKSLSQFDSNFKSEPEPDILLDGRKAQPSSSPIGKPSSFMSNDEKKAEKLKKFSETNEERYAWLLDIRDAERRRPDDPEYDPRTLYIPSSAWSQMKPFEKQFWDIKRKCWDTVLFFQKGKFYELYENDATLGHQMFDLKLTDRVNMRMVGVPESTFEHWASQFVARGYKIGRVDQMQTALGKEMSERGAKANNEKIVRRELTQLLTSATLVDERMITSEMGIYCICIKEICSSEYSDPSIGACWVDASTGEFKICRLLDDMSRTKLDTLITQIQPRELILEKGRLTKRTISCLKRTTGSSTAWTYLIPDKEFWDEAETERHFQRADYFVRGNEPAPLKEAFAFPETSGALGGLISYLQYLKLDRELVSLGNFETYDPCRSGKTLILNGQTISNLELFANSSDGSEEGTLFNLICRCSTPFGKRLLKTWLCHPLAQIEAIQERLDAVDAINADLSCTEMFSQYFGRLPDLERLISRVHAGRCRPKDFVRVLQGFLQISKGFKQMKKLPNLQTKVISRLLAVSSEIESLLDQWKDAFDWDKAFNEGLMIPSKGTDAEFDNSVEAIEQAEATLNSRIDDYCKLLGSSNISFKAVGKEIYQIEVPKSLKSKVPANWSRLSGTSKVDRYWPPDMPARVKSFQELQETHSQIVKELESRIYGRFDENFSVWSSVVKATAVIDCLMSLAITSRSMGSSCRPEFIKDDRAVLKFEELRHPCVSLGAVSDFIPNDINIGGDDKSMILLTGPNMAGKSTLLRQTCIAVILAQVGCNVPARKARLTPVDSIKSRVGAQDNIMASHSTFMVELTETKKILEEATPNSLVILDELGRGTSTFDGAAIAYAVLHHLVTHVGCLGFFSTHYSSLALEFLNHPEVFLKNMSAMVDEEKRQVTFLYKLVDGVCSSSHGMSVAAMAGVPHSVIDVAEVNSAKLEQTSRARAAHVLASASSFDNALVSEFAWLYQHREGKQKDTPSSMVLNRILEILE